MDEFLAVVGVQAMRYAIRSGIALTSTYALGQCSRILSKVDDKVLFSQLDSLHKLLDSKIKIISPALDLIEFKSSRGNTFLESAAPLAKSLQTEIVSLGRQIETVVVNDGEALGDDHRHKKTVNHQDLLLIIASIKGLLDTIDRNIPLLQLAISASGESLSTSIPASISPSRLLQASTFLIIGDTQFAQDPIKPIQIGPSFTLSLYMLFLGHASTLAPYKTSDATNATEASSTSVDTISEGQKGTYGLGEGEKKPLWQEVLHKARVRLCRTRCDQIFDSKFGYRSMTACESPSLSAYDNRQYTYHLEIIEDLNDGRLHDDVTENRSYDDIPSAGIRESIPIRQLSKIFYTDTGSLLNIGNPTGSEQNPVLLLKRDIEAMPATDMAESCVESSASPLTVSEGGDEQAEIDQQLLQGNKDYKATTALDGGFPNHHSQWKFPLHLDPEWIALEVFQEDEDNGVDEDNISVESGTVDEPEETAGLPRERLLLDPKLVDQIKRLSLKSSSQPDPSEVVPHLQDTVEIRDFVARSPFGAITTSLSLMEILIRLTSLQEFQQASHLSIPDHILTFFLEETSTTGLVGESQWATRSMAKRRMGFDPYTDAPTK